MPDEIRREPRLAARGVPVVGSTVAGKYVVDALIGKGGMGFVVSAIHRELDQRVAIKFLLPEMVENEEAVVRFLREAKLAAKLKSEHSVRVFDVGTTEERTPYMVMEHLVGNDLDKELERRGPLSIAEVADWMQQAVAALAEAHVLGIVHRDLKPSNLFLATQGRRAKVIKILDFGISKLESEKMSLGLTSTKAILGSPSYMSPEQIKSSRSVDSRSDIWSLGVVMYQLLTDQLPFVPDEESIGELFGLILHTEPKPLQAIRPDLDSDLVDIVMRCLEKSRDKRFQDVGKFAEALQPHSSATSAGLVEYTKNAVRSLPPPRGSSPDIDDAELELAGLATPARAPEGAKTELYGPAGAMKPKIAGVDVLAPTATLSRAPKAIDRVALAESAVGLETSSSLPMHGSRRKLMLVAVTGIAFVGFAASMAIRARAVTSDGNGPAKSIDDGRRPATIPSSPLIAIPATSMQVDLAGPTTVREPTSPAPQSTRPAPSPTAPTAAAAAPSNSVPRAGGKVGERLPTQRGKPAEPRPATPNPAPVTEKDRGF